MVGPFPVLRGWLPRLFRLTKSRRTFYAKIERLCFHTASTHCSRFPHDTGWTAVDPLLTFAPTDESGVLQARGFPEYRIRRHGTGPFHRKGLICFGLI